MLKRHFNHHVGATLAFIALSGMGCAVKFNTSSATTATATLTISDGANYDYGTKTLNSTNDYTFTITNTDTGTATLGTISTAGLSLSGAYSLTTGGTCATGGTLAGSATCTLIIRYLPTSIGPQSESIDVAYTDSSGSKTVSRAITGSTSSPSVTFTTPSADGTSSVLSNVSAFPIAGACTTSSGTVTISNSSGTAYKTTTCTSGAWSTTINLSALSDGAVSLTASQTENTLTGSASRSVTVTQAYCNAHSADANLITSQAGYPAGTGTSGNPYLICHATHLGDVKNRLTGAHEYFKLMNNINVGGNFTAITGFNGDDFNGNSLTISNVTFIGAGNRGLFDQIDGASYVHHLTLSTVTIGSVAALAGSLAGKIVNTTGSVSTIDNITISGTTITGGANQYVGGIAGVIEGYVALTNISVTSSGITASGATSEAGGISGDFWMGSGSVAPTLTDATITGSVSGNNAVGGAIAVLENASLLRVSYSGTVTASAGGDVGGLVGKIQTGTSSFSYCSSSGSVVAPGSGNYAGGLLGQANSVTSISNSYSTSSVTAAGIDQVGGLVAGGTVTTIDKSYATGNVSGHNEVGGFAGDITSTITKSYATGNATGNDNVAGFVAGPVTTVSITDAYAWGSVTSTVANKSFGFSASGAAGTTLVRVYSKGAVSAAGGNNGVANVTTASTNVFWNTTTSGQSANTGSAASGLSDTNSKVLSNYTNFSGSGNWKIDTAISPYPILQWQ